MAFYDKWQRFLDEAESQVFAERLLKGVPPAYKSRQSNWGGEEETSKRSQAQKESIINSLYGIKGEEA